MTELFDICGIPAFLEPWINRFYTPLEIDLLTNLNGKAMTAAEARQALGPESSDSLLERAWRRGVVRRLDDGRVTPADFHVRFESWALSIVKEANRQGLMQGAELAVDSQGRLDGALCNCCNDCCFPHQLARILEVEKFWPLSRYLAQLSPEPCNGCGRCIRRCPFDAITQAKKKKGMPPSTPVIEANLCRGCGVCATGCPQEAICMQKIRASELETYYA